jgi:hypothetical protein
MISAAHSRFGGRGGKRTGVKVWLPQCEIFSVKTVTESKTLPGRFVMSLHKLLQYFDKNMSFTLNTCSEILENTVLSFAALRCFPIEALKELFQAQIRNRRLVSADLLK